VAFTELPKQADDASPWKTIRISMGLAFSAVLIPLLFVPISNMPLSSALTILIPTVGFAALMLHRGIKGAERLWYALTPQDLTLERYRGALHIPLDAIEYLRVVPLGGTSVPNSFPGYHVGKAKVPVLGKRVMVVASSLQGEGLLIGYGKGGKAHIEEVVVTPEEPEAVKLALEALIQEKRARTRS
jgi:hypothetical protein